MENGILQTARQQTRNEEKEGKGEERGKEIEREGKKKMEGYRDKASLSVGSAAQPATSRVVKKQSTAAAGPF